MKNKLIAVAALVSVAGAAGAARADDLNTLKQQTEQLKQQNQDLVQRLDRLEKQQATQPTPDSFVAQASAPLASIVTGDGPLTWHGITLFGALDAGVNWQSHTAPMSPYYVQGIPYAISKFNNRAGFNIAPGAAGASGIGIKGAEELLPGLSGVFAANTTFNLATGTLSNAPQSLIANNGVPTAYQSSNGDSSKAGQTFNDYAYIGLAHQTFGTLTFGRHKSIETDILGAYDPISGAQAFSEIAFSGTLAGGITENARLDDSLKYQVNFGPVRAGGIYQFSPTGYGGSNNATLPPGTYQVSLGGDIGAFSTDIAYGHSNDAIALASLSAAQVLKLPSNTLSATLANTDSFVIAAKYTYDKFKFSGGYEYVQYSTPSTIVTATATQPFQTNLGLTVSTIAADPYAYHDKVLQFVWGGVKYAYSDRLDLSAAYYHQWQNSYGQYGCSTPTGVTVGKTVVSGSACSGTMDVVGALAAYHFTKRLQAYGGMMFSSVTNGMASGYLYHVNYDPTIGLRYTF